LVSRPQLLHFVLLRSFDASAEGLLDDDDLATLQGILNADPRAGRVITSQRRGGESVAADAWSIFTLRFARASFCRVPQE
jgi:hypothetical protein